MTITESPAATPARSVSGTAPVSETAGLYQVVTTGDHKTLGRLYIGFAALFFLGAMVLGVVNGIERADPESLDVFNDITTYFQSFWAYRLGLVFLVALPALRRARDGDRSPPGRLALAGLPPRGAAAFWTWLVGSGMLIASFATDGGLGELADGATRSDSVALTLVALGMIILALCLASICIATTVIAARTTGMTLRRVPLFSWSMLVASFVWLSTLPSCSPTWSSPTSTTATVSSSSACRARSTSSSSGRSGSRRSTRTRSRCSAS